MRLSVYGYLDDVTLLTKIAQLSKFERAVIVNSKEARTDAKNDRRLLLKLGLHSMTRGPLQSFAKDLTYFISIVGEVSIKLHIERPIITISSIVTESDKYSIELIKRVSTEVGRLISELDTTADHKVSMVLSVSHGDR